MKRELIVSVVAILLLALFCGLALLLLLLVFPLAWFFISRKTEKEPTSADRPTVYESVDEVIARYGEPDDVVVLDASRANDLQALILFYPGRDVVVVTGRELKLSDLVAVAPKNMATPYTVDEWAVVVNTRRRDCPTLTLRVGYDGALAGEIAAQIDQHLQR